MKVKPAGTERRVVIELGPGESRLVAQGAHAPYKLKSILVPVDFSECSYKALQYAWAFAQQFQASLTLLHVIQIPYGYGEAAIVDMGNYTKEIEADAKKRLTSLTEDLPNKDPIQTVVRNGSPYDEIIRAAQDNDVDLIIIATHGRSGFRRFLVGSTTERVVRHATCPVLVVRDKEHDFVDMPIVAKNG